MIGINAKVTDNLSKKANEIQKQLELLAKYRLIVKFNEEALEENGVKVEKVAVWMEYGKDSFNVHYPARPFWRGALDGNIDRIKRRFINNAKQVSIGKMEARKCFEDIGKQVVSMIQKSILEGEYAPLADSTARKREKEGKGIQPLIDTRTMLESVEYEVKEV